ncbi:MULTISPECIES: glycosyltransferase family A protein [unclassified Flavobacterium]|uniref:glycosyltransferase family A protein n=1 Tax=unclassified Flavobacterium TaxID=196869 RepID=UPI000F8417CD|nr:MULTISPECIES: glycosyltransferase family A protein [unclassified Flavobacterium]RTY71271.1 glycosyltransferase family 2 protein [Flavobacterium sp. LB2P53]RTY76863.1 glycosyltransferase family 2 protein [Flavobacterium sp. LS1R10]RTY95473.1 glycosyltransferase family 2 protein [Flavobacterium sp. GSN2]
MLAIVIPYYKITFFEDTLESLVNQTDKRFNVYIGNDASPEDPEFLLEKYIAKFDFVYHGFENNLGSISLTQHWERCIALSISEEWIMILGDDDVLGVNVVEAFYANLLEIIKKEIHVVRFRTSVKLNDSLSTRYKTVHPKIETISDFYYRKFKGLTRSSLSEYIFEREVYTKNKFKDYPLAWHSDDIAWLDFSENKPIYSISDAEIVIRISDQSISGKTNDKPQKDRARLLFFSELVTNSFDKFSNKTKLLLLLRYEVILKDQNKMNAERWFFIVKKYIKIGSFVAVAKVFRRILINKFLK